MMLTDLWTFERGVLLAIDLADPRTIIQPRLEVGFKPVGPESVPALARAMGENDYETVRQRMTAGRRCFAAWFQDAIVAYGWVSQCSEYIGEQERELKLEPDEAYIWDCATLPAFRGQSLYSALLSHILSVLQAEGLCRVWIGTSASNIASVHGMIRAGFRPVLNLTYARLLNLRLLWLAAQSGAPTEPIAGARRDLLSSDERAWGPLVIARAPSLQGPAGAGIKA